MGMDIVINYPLWIVAKRVGAGLSALPPSTQAVRRRRRALGVDRPYHHHRGRRVHGPKAAVWGPRGVCGVRRDRGRLRRRRLTGRTVHHRGPRQLKCIIGRERLPWPSTTRRRRWINLAARHAATACREVPFAAALFAVRPRLRKIAEERYPTTQRFLRELSCGVAAASVAGPASHAPSVVAAYQQATDVTPRQAIAKIRAAGGLEFFRGLPARTLSLAGTFTVVPLALDWFAVQ